MAADKPRPTLADYVTVVISPALIMAMIVSLVFFLLAIFYRGEFAGRLHHLLFFFVFGIVLVGRIAMATGGRRAGLYGAVLAFLTWIGMGNFVQYPPELAAPSWLINAGLIALAWWLSHQLTYSCTYIDEKAESTGTGVLQGAGLEGAPLAANDQEPAPPEDKRNKKTKTWWDRYRSFRAERKKTQPPGVWVVYFGLAALPIFGLGQALIEVGDTARRAWTFWLMTIYLASSIGLLVTTAFLGLRRYLRQRRLEMPKRVTAAWLILGAGLLAAFLVVGASLPRPQAEFSPWTSARAGSKELAASKHAVTQGDPGKGEGKPGQQEHDPKGAPKPGKKGSAGKDGKGQAKEKSSDSKGNSRDAAKKSGSERDSKKDNDGKSETPSRGDTEPQSDSADNTGGSSWLKSLLETSASVLKWIVFAILAFVTALFILRGGLHYLANFSNWARRLLEALRRLWESLFGAQPGVKAPAHGADGATPERHVSFHAFANPFHDGRAERMEPAYLVRYTFEALEAWAAERNCGRASQETPLEFTHRLASATPPLEKETKDLGSLVARVLYARGALTSDWRDTLRSVWDRLEGAAHQSFIES
jgi:hypothetical protein